MSYATIADGYDSGMVYSRPSGGYYYSESTQLFTDPIYSSSTFYSSHIQRILGCHYMIYRSWPEDSIRKRVIKMLIDQIPDREVYLHFLKFFYNRNYNIFERTVALIKSLFCGQISKNKKVNLPNRKSYIKYLKVQIIFPFGRVYMKTSRRMKYSFLPPSKLLERFTKVKSLTTLSFYSLPTLYIYDVLYILNLGRRRYLKKKWSLIENQLWCVMTLDEHINRIVDKTTNDIWFINNYMPVSPLLRLK